MIKKKDDFNEKNSRDIEITKNSFTQAVKKAGSGANDITQTGIEDHAPEENKEISLQAYDDLMRAKEAKNDTTVEGEKFRRDE